MAGVGVAVVGMMLSTLLVVMAAPQPGTTEEVDLHMPNVKPQTPGTYLCKAMKVEDAHRYITGFIPKADAMIAHHILLYGCDQPGAEPGQVWNCGEMSSSTSNNEYQQGPVCQSGESILYAWAMEAPRLILPNDVSFDVGQETPTRYLVLQVHYKNVTKFLPPQNGDDSSGLTLETTRSPTSKQAGMYMMATGGGIPSHTVEYFETACTLQEDVEIHPFAYRTHAHGLGRVISGYRIRDGEWTEIGRKDPRLPEMFYNVTTPGMTMHRGDIVAARCTMENTRDHDVAIGATVEDEMCNFYIMYYVERPPIMEERVCATPGPPMWYWQDFPDQEAINLKAMPKTVSVIPGTEKALIRNTTDMDGYRRNEVVPGIPGRFQDIDTDAIVDEAIRDLNSDDLLYIVQQLVAEEEEEEARDRMLRQQQARRLQANGGRVPYQSGPYYNGPPYVVPRQ